MPEIQPPPQKTLGVKVSGSGTKNSDHKSSYKSKPEKQPSKQKTLAVKDSGGSKADKNKSNGGQTIQPSIMAIFGYNH